MNKWYFTFLFVQNMDCKCESSGSHLVACSLLKKVYCKETANSLSGPWTKISHWRPDHPRWIEKAQITAIYNKRDKCQAENYRPVSLTTVVCNYKVMETLVR